jgi:hypothetical protein
MKELTESIEEQLKRNLDYMNGSIVLQNSDSCKEETDAFIVNMCVFNECTQVPPLKINLGGSKDVENSIGF